MRVLLLNQTYLPDPVATSQYLGRWAEHLAREGNEVTVLAGRQAYQDPDTEHPARETRDGVKVVRVPGGGGRTRRQRLAGFARFLLAVLARGLTLPRPEVIVTLTSPPLLPAVAALLARLQGARLLIWAMDLHPEAAIAAGLLREKSVAANVARRLARWSLRRADVVVTLDGHMRRRLGAQGLDTARIAVVPLWMQADVTYDAVGRENTRRSQGWRGKFVVMCAGNHGVCHSMRTLLAAAEALRDEPSIHFCWVGGGSQWPMLRRHAARNVSLLSYVPRTRLAAVLSAADLQVVVMGAAFVGLLHPCKIYHILAVQRPLLYIGPERGPVPDILRAARLGEGAASVREGDSAAVTNEIRRRACSLRSALSPEADLAPWQESLGLKKMTSILGHVRRFIQPVHESPCPAVASPDAAGLVVSASGGRGDGHRR